jgi:hypothetical protein
MIIDQLCPAGPYHVIAHGWTRSALLQAASGFQWSREQIDLDAYDDTTGIQVATLDKALSLRAWLIAFTRNDWRDRKAGDFPVKIQPDIYGSSWLDILKHARDQATMDLLRLAQTANDQIHLLDEITQATTEALTTWQEHATRMAAQSQTWLEILHANRPVGAQRGDYAFWSRWNIASEQAQRVRDQAAQDLETITTWQTQDVIQQARTTGRLPDMLQHEPI